jgi:hypothetical protein
MNDKIFQNKKQKEQEDITGHLNILKQPIVSTTNKPKIKDSCSTLDFNE